RTVGRIAPVGAAREEGLTGVVHAEALLGRLTGQFLRLRTGLEEAVVVEGKGGGPSLRFDDIFVGRHVVGRQLPHAEGAGRNIVFFPRIAVGRVVILQRRQQGMVVVLPL